MKMVAKIRPKVLGNPKAGALLDNDEKVHWLGHIIGKASGFKKSADPRDDTKVSYALLGFFEARPEDGGEVSVSDVCWLPQPLHDRVLNAVRALPPAYAIPFCFHIGTRRDAKESVGYSYIIDQDGVEYQPEDILSNIRPGKKRK
jgi:hypothetical protein